LSLTGFTGQYSHAADFGLLFYNARWYDVSLGRFAQADSIVPPGVQGLDRYSYTNNNPVRYTDPSGHICTNPEDADNGLSSSKCDKADKPRGSSRNKKKNAFNIGVFTEDELLQFGIDCGKNVAQTACDVYTKGNKIRAANTTVDFKDGNVGNMMTYLICNAIFQGCLYEGNEYTAQFFYKSSFMGSGTSWNRYVTDSHGNTHPLFTANWSIAEFGGELVARETFPLRGGDLGYGSVFLSPSAENNSIVWRSIGVEYGTQPHSGINVNMPEPPLIVFTTSQASDGPSNYFYTEGTFSIGGNVLGTISISGYIER
jgi:RHS repeat-associated protein